MANSFADNRTDAWVGAIAGARATLTLELHNDEIHAKIDIGGYIYKLHLKLEIPQIATGYMEDEAGQKIGAGLVTNDDGFVLIIDKPTGPEHTLFTEAQPDHVSEIPATNTSQGMQHDPRLIGGWRNSESHSSGEFSMVSEFTIEFRADGTYVEYEGRAIGGIGGVGGDTGPGTGQTLLYWRSENGVLFIGPHPDQLQPTVPYQVDASSLLLLPQNGERAFYSRIY